MSVLINTNIAATEAAQNLSIANASLQKSIQQLSSGSKITNPSDDAGGLAISMRMTSAINDTSAANSNVQNSISFLQTQDGALSTANAILNRISQLKTLSEDPTKTTGDIADYNTEFKALQSQLTSIAGATFNGQALFAASSDTTATTMTVYTSADDATSQSVSLANLAYQLSGILAASDTISDITLTANGAASDTTNVTTAISNLGTMRAQNGADQSNLGFASNLLSTNETNLTAANSQIVDVDVAQASTQLAQNNVLVQAGTSMLSQANSSSQIALKLLQ
jgi:flagellin